MKGSRFVALSTRERLVIGKESCRLIEIVGYLKQTVNREKVLCVPGLSVV